MPIHSSLTNNDILRQLRYTFNLGDSQMISTFEAADSKVTRAQVSNWLKKEDDEMFEHLLDIQLATFLNGFINVKRGKKEGPQAMPEDVLDNNNILRKLKIALALKDTDMLDIFELVNLRVSKHEISAFFRNPKQTQYRECKDQFIRNFLHGLQLKYRDNVVSSK